MKWLETRREHLCTAVHAREQWHDMQLAVRNDGTILGMRTDILCDQGAYTRSLGLLCPSITSASLPGPYRIQNYACRVRVALTNKAPAGAYRGAGQPEAVFATERIVDRLAQELGLDPAEVRRKNFIGPDEFPWELGQLASAAAPGEPLPADMSPGLEATHYFLAPLATFASGLHVAVVEIDRDTLEVKVLDYAVVSDAGTLINPLIVEGQIVGGVAQGIGGALFEELAYDEQANFISQSLLDYCMPSAAQIPPIKIAHLYTRSPLNPLGSRAWARVGRWRRQPRSRMLSRTRCGIGECASMRRL